MFWIKDGNIRLNLDRADKLEFTDADTLDVTLGSQSYLVVATGLRDAFDETKTWKQGATISEVE